MRRRISRRGGRGGHRAGYGVGLAQVVGQQCVAVGWLPAAPSRQTCSAREAMDAVRPAGRRPGRLERAPEAYRPVAHGQRCGRHCRDAARRAPRGRARRREQRRAAAPDGGEHLAAAGVEDGEHALPSPGARARAPRACSTPTSGSAARLRQRARGRDPDPQAGEAARARRPTASRVDLVPAHARRRQRLLAPPQQPRRVRRPRARRRVVAHLDDDPVRAAARPPTVARRGGVEPEHDHEITVRAGRRPRARARRAARPALAQQRVEPAPLGPLHERDRARAPKYGSSSPGSSSSSPASR